MVVHVVVDVDNVGDAKGESHRDDDSGVIEGEHPHQIVKDKSLFFSGQQNEGGHIDCHPCHREYHQNYPKVKGVHGVLLLSE